MTEQTPDPIQDLIDSVIEARADHCHWCHAFRMDYGQTYCPDHVPGPTQSLEPTIEALERWAPWFNSTEMGDAIIYLRRLANLITDLGPTRSFSVDGGPMTDSPHARP